MESTFIWGAKAAFHAFIKVSLLLTELCVFIHFNLSACVFIAPLYDSIRRTGLGPLGHTEDLRFLDWTLVMFMVCEPCPSKAVTHLPDQPGLMNISFCRGVKDSLFSLRMCLWVYVFIKEKELILLPVYEKWQQDTQKGHKSVLLWFDELWAAERTSFCTGKQYLLLDFLALQGLPFCRFTRHV